MSGVKCVTLIVKGRVQGVFYRDSTRRKALELGLTGTVRNLPDGSVEIVAEGPPGKLDALVRWARQGPPAAVVTDVEIFPDAGGAGFEGFAVLY